jgi:hypothetical protein
MSSYRTRKAAATVDPPPMVPGGTVEIAAYVGELLKGVRQLTQRGGQKDFAFLDYLLAMAEAESGCLAANIYH